MHGSHVTAELQNRTYFPGDSADFFLFFLVCCRIARLAEVFGQSVYELCAKITAVNDIRSVSISLVALS